MIKSLPSREAWIEIPSVQKADFHRRSLPSREAWIEIHNGDGVIRQKKSRFPRGKRGLKSGAEAYYVGNAMSLPSREAWIEIAWIRITTSARSSLPSREAWIEIRRAHWCPRGMKVASLAGSVD